MYRKYLIVASKKDKAGINITTALSQFRPNEMMSAMAEKPIFDFYIVDEEIIFTESLDLEKIKKYDFIIFASRHKSSSGEKTLSIHNPGNFRDAQYGGVKGKVCPASAIFQKQMYEKLHNVVKEYNVDNYNITLEATHHGPLINRPCLFIEIGPSETEWADRRAAFVIAKTIYDTINSFKYNQYNEVAIAIGGPHYCPSFNQIQAESNVAISHVIPNYVSPITEDMIKEAINKTAEEVDFALIDWKGLKGEERSRVIEILEKNYINWKKTSDVEN